LIAGEWKLFLALTQPCRIQVVTLFFDINKEWSGMLTCVVNNPLTINACLCQPGCTFFCVFKGSSYIHIYYIATPYRSFSVTWLITFYSYLIIVVEERKSAQFSMPNNLNSMFWSNLLMQYQTKRWFNITSWWLGWLPLSKFEYTLRQFKIHSVETARQMVPLKTCLFYSHESLMRRC